MAIIPRSDLLLRFGLRAFSSDTNQAPRDAVPSGTVASRIIDLQNLVRFSASGRLSPAAPRRENSRTGFGRRASARFGQPATRSSKPDEQPKVEAKHSFLGLTTRRANHSEEHALVDGRMKWVRTAGLHGQLQPSGWETRVQYEATSPWGFLPKSKSYKNMQREYSQHETDGLKVCTLTPKPNASAPNSPLPSLLAFTEIGRTMSTQERSEHLLDEWRRGTASRHRRINSSSQQMSAETTGTTRRQSVKDLFHYCRIQRPVGLISSENVANDPDSTYCRCGHHLSKKFVNRSLKDVATKYGSASYTDKTPKHKSQPSKGKGPGKKSSEYETTKQKQEQPDPSQRSLKKDSLTQMLAEDQTSGPRQKWSSRSEYFPTLHQEGPTPRPTSRKTPTMSSVKLPGPPELLRESKSGPEVGSGAKDSPFLIDTVSPSYHLNLLPVAMQTTSLHSQPRHHGCHHRRKRHYRDGSHSSSSSEINNMNEFDDCDSSGCNAIYPDHQPYSHSNFCLRKRRRHLNETDSGYVAGTSHLDELDVPQPNSHTCSKQKHQEHGQQRHSNERESSHYSKSDLSHDCTSHRGEHEHDHQEEKHRTANGCKMDCPKQVQHDHALHNQKEHTSSLKSALPISEYFECHGYPRIEHALQYNPIISGVVGECQHCLNDYLCEACQRTIHTVRRCVYGDYHSLSHHSTPGEECEILLRQASPTVSLETSQRAFPQRSGPHSGEHCISTTLAPAPRRNITSPPWMSDDLAGTLREEAKQDTLASSKQKSKQEASTTWKCKFRRKTSMIEPPTAFRKITLQATPCDSSSLELNQEHAQEPFATVSSTHTGHDSYTYPPDSHCDPCCGSTTPTVSQPSEPSSPGKSKSVAHLSAFFRLQDQNIVPLLSERLQKHQEELKRIERLSLDEERGKDEDGQKKLTQKKPAEDIEQHTLTSQHTLRDCGEVVRNGGEMVQKSIPLTADPPKMGVGEQEREEHECAWKEIAMRDARKFVEAHRPGPETIKESGEKVLRDTGINGITIVIHLEGKNDMVIRTDLSNASWN